MPRDSNIPLFLWIATAVLAHLLWGGGADRAARLIEERLDIKRFAVSVKNHVRGTGKPIEIALVDDSAPAARPEVDEEEPKEKDPPDDEKEEDKEKEKEKPKVEVAKPDKKKPETPPVEPEKPKQELVVKKEQKPEEKAEAKPLPKPDPSRRIAVQQHVQDPNQKDNPNAEFIADQANKVAEQTQARITSTDQNDPNPTPGAAHAGPSSAPGNSDESRVAQSEDREGEQDRAPNDGSRSAQKIARATEPPKAGDPSSAPQPEAAARPAPQTQKGPLQAQPAEPRPPDPGQVARSPVPGAEAMPETVTSDQGAPGIARQQERIAAQRARRARKKRLPPPPRSRSASDLLGLGALGTTPNGINLNLTPQTALAAIGQDRLRKELTADAERRRSAHRGSWKTLGIERWRSAIENYVPSVKPGNQTALNTARVPFASYLNTIHNRLHPIFADSFLASLDSLPGGHPMNRSGISTNLEIVLDQVEGRIVRMGITKTSGVTAFDIAALESVNRAQPFGPPPREIVSPDGNVYFHWEFWREPFYACSTYFARPFILKVKPKSAPPAIEPPPSRPYDPSEPPQNDQGGDQHGALEKRRLEKHAALR